jgi:hypothetical protein
MNLRPFNVTEPSRLRSAGWTAASALAAVLCLVSPAHATTITVFDNIVGAVTGGAAIYGANTIGGVQDAVGFIPSTSAFFDSATVMVETFGGNSDYVATLTADASGVPGTPLETISTSFSGVGYTPQTITSTVHAALDAGTLYWLMLSAAPGNPDGKAGWALYAPPGIFVQRQNGGSWTADTPPAGLTVFGTVADESSPVPEPATMTLVGLGSAAAVARRLRRRRA